MVDYTVVQIESLGIVIEKSFQANCLLFEGMELRRHR